MPGVPKAARFFCAPRSRARAVGHINPAQADVARQDGRIRLTEFTKDSAGAVLILNVLGG